MTELREQVAHPPPIPSPVRPGSSSTSSFSHLQQSLDAANAELLESRAKVKSLQAQNVELQQANNKLQLTVITLQSETGSLREQLKVTEEDLQRQLQLQKRLEEEYKVQLKEVEDAAELALNNAVAEAKDDRGGILGSNDYWNSGGRQSPSISRVMGGNSFANAVTHSSVMHGGDFSPNNSKERSPAVALTSSIATAAASASGKLVSLYQERLAGAENVNAELRAIIATLRKTEAEATQEREVLRNRIDVFERENASVTISLSSSERARESLLEKIADLEIQLRRSKENVHGSAIGGLGAVSTNDYAIQMDINDAHAWWGYVWHECRKELRDDQKALEDIVLSNAGTSGSLGITSGNRTATIGASTAFMRLSEEDNALRMDSIQRLNSPDEADMIGARTLDMLQQRLASQRADLRAQAIELASVRQVCNMLIFISLIVIFYLFLIILSTDVAC